MDPSQHLQHNVMHPGIANQPGPVVIPDSTYMIPSLSITVPGQMRTSMNQNNVLHLQRQAQMGIPTYTQQMPPGVGPEELMSGPMNNIYLTSDMNMHHDVNNEMHSMTVNTMHQEDDMDNYPFPQYLSKTSKQGIKLRPPKRASSAYGCFSRKIYKQTRDELSGAKQSEIFSHIAQLWRDMTEEQKEPYNKESNEDKNRHKQEESSYKRLRKEVEKNYTPRLEELNPLSGVANTIRGSKTLQRAMHNKDSEKLASLLLSANNNDINGTLILLKESANIIIHAGEQLRMDKLPDFSNTPSNNKRKYPPSKRYHCPHMGCNKTFAWKSNMTVHLRTHDLNRRRDYICRFPNCNKAFFDNQHLKQHQWIHTRNPEGYSCPQPGCNKKYATRGGLQLHVKAHHKVEKKYKCDIDGCDRAFVRRTDLKVHILRVHSDCKPHPCPHPNCNKSYVTLAELKRHFATHNHNSVLQSLSNSINNNTITNQISPMNTNNTNLPTLPSSIPQEIQTLTSLTNQVSQNVNSMNSNRMSLNI